MAKRSLKKPLLAAVIVVLFVGLAASTVYFYMDNKDLKAELALSEQDRAKRKNDSIKTAVSELMTLPNEEPIFIRINDPSRADEEFKGITTVFNDLQKDDYLLVYKKEKLGIQYREKENKIIKTAPVSLPIVVEVIGPASAVDTVALRLEQYGNQITIVKTVNEDITTAGIFDTNNDQSAEVQSISESLKIDPTATLPNTVTPNQLSEIVLLVTDSAATQRESN